MSVGETLGFQSKTLMRVSSVRGPENQLAAGEGRGTSGQTLWELRGHHGIEDCRGGGGVCEMTGGKTINSVQDLFETFPK